MRGIFQYISYALRHPIGKLRPVRTLWRIFLWQVLSRIRTKPHTYHWIENSSLVMRRGLTGASGNLYLGLHECADMGFFLHFLRPDDLFLDIGANVGSFTILASKLCGAETMAFEPDPQTAAHLRANLRANKIEDRVVVRQHALGESEGEIAFTVGLDAINRVATEDDLTKQTVPIMRLDSALGDLQPIAAKLDVEGFEEAVLNGAQTMLSQPSLQALEVETVTAECQTMLEHHGFSRYYYDPFSRQLTKQPNDLPANNMLFIRDLALAEARLQSARKFNVYGILL